MPPQPITATFSIVAVDPDAGTCGAAVASKYPAVGKVVAFARAGVGAFCTQHYSNTPWGPLALELLAAGNAPEAVLTELLRTDSLPGKRQLALIDRQGRVAVHNPIAADPDGLWWGALCGRFYSCQGNTLVGVQVVVAMATAFEQTSGHLADRLVAALLAGDQAGGDHRGRLAAGLRVAGPGVRHAAAELDVDNHPDAVAELGRLYSARRAEVLELPDALGQDRPRSQEK
jgi:uncharacterized Ntn-hydrolase superfamily protein